MTKGASLGIHEVARPGSASGLRPLRKVGSSAHQVNWPLVALGVVIAVSLAVDVWWLDEFRRGYPLDIDESRYLELGLRLRDGLLAAGPGRFWHIWSAQHDFGPLLPVVSVPVYLIAGHTVLGGLATQLLFFVLLVMSSYGIGSRLSSRWGGVIVAVVVAGAPAVIDFTRSYQFALTDAAVVAGATYALLASEAFTHRGWSLVWGLLVGLTPLARTMAIAFVPAQLLAAVWLVLARPEARPPDTLPISRNGQSAGRGVRVINLALALGLAAIAAASWLATSWRSVSSYLTNFGYGAQSAHFSHSGSRLRVGYWTREAVGAVKEDLYLPLAALLVLCLTVALVVSVARRNTRSLVRWTKSDAAIVLFILLEGYVVVSSSRNEGVGFRVPLIAMLVALVVSAVVTLPWRPVRGALAGGLIAVSILNVIMKADAIAGLSGTHSVKIAGFGSVPTLDGLGYIQGYVLGSLEARYVSATHPLPTSQKEWLPAYDRTVREVLRLARRGRYQPRVGLATDEPLLNVNDFTLAARLDHRRDLAVSLLPTPPGPPTLTAYRRLLEGTQRGLNELITVTSVGVSYFALTGLQDIQQGLLERAGASAGFTCGGGISLPDGRVAVVSWRRPQGTAGQLPRSCSPHVTHTIPAAGAKRTPLTGAVIAVFSLPMVPGPLRAAFSLTDGATRHRVAGTVRRFGEIAVIFRPDHRLASHTRFTAIVSTRAVAATGAALPSAERWSFTTR